MENTNNTDFDLNGGNNGNSNTNTSSGGMSLNMSFFEYITTFSNNEKAQVLNMLQYGGLAVLPLLILLKVMKMYVPEEDPLKGTPELSIEVLLQLGFILVAFFFIHKLVLYLPTYSNVDYEHLNLLSVILPVFFLMFALDTGIGSKLNILFDRLLLTVGIKKEPLQNKEPVKKNGLMVGETTTRTLSNEQVSQQQDPMASRMIDGFPTQREPQVQEPMMMMREEPVAANEAFGGSLF